MHWSTDLVIYILKWEPSYAFITKEPVIEGKITALLYENVKFIFYFFLNYLYSQALVFHHSVPNFVQK